MTLGTGGVDGEECSLDRSQGPAEQIVEELLPVVRPTSAAIAGEQLTDRTFNGPIIEVLGASEELDEGARGPALSF